MSLVRNTIAISALTLFFAAPVANLPAQSLPAPAEPAKVEVAPENTRRIFSIRLSDRDLTNYLNSWRLSRPGTAPLVEKLLATHCRQVILPIPADDDAWKLTRELALALHGKAVEIAFELHPEQSQDDVIKELAIFDELLAEKAKTDLLGQAARAMQVAADDGKPVCRGFFMPLVVGESLPQGLTSQLSAKVFDRFVREMKLGDDLVSSLETDARREQFLKSTGLMPWLKWRSTKVAEFYDTLAAALARQTGQSIVVAAPSSTIKSTSDELSDIQRSTVSPILAWREVGFVPESWAQTGRFRLIGSQTLDQNESEMELIEHPDLVRAMKPRSREGHWFRAGAVVSPGLFHFGRDRSLVLQSPLTSTLANSEPALIVLDYAAVENQPGRVAHTIDKFHSLSGRGVSPMGTGAVLQGVSARAYGKPADWNLVIFNALPFRVQVGVHGEEARPLGEIKVLDAEITPIQKPGPEAAARQTFNLSPHSWGRLHLAVERADLIGISTEVPDDARDIVQTRYDELINHQPASASPDTTPASNRTSAERSRGRRLMAALQAYRERRLADFFRLSEGLTRDRRNVISRTPAEDSENRRILR
ncbi:MAG: hypothetical protein ACKO85_07555 [Isosphaeraceae bacterium]